MLLWQLFDVRVKSILLHIVDASSWPRGKGAKRVMFWWIPAPSTLQRPPFVQAYLGWTSDSLSGRWCSWVRTPIVCYCNVAMMNCISDQICQDNHAVSFIATPAPWALQLLLDVSTCIAALTTQSLVAGSLYDPSIHEMLTRLLHGV